MFALSGSVWIAVDNVRFTPADVQQMTPSERIELIKLLAGDDLVLVNARITHHGTRVYIPGIVPPGEWFWSASGDDPGSDVWLKVEPANPLAGSWVHDCVIRGMTADGEFPYPDGPA